jgi:hypothetical protein
VSFANKDVSGLQKYLRFQNEYNKVEIELRVMQFLTEIKLVITNRTPASRLCDFVITRLISVQIALHSVQLPLLIYVGVTTAALGGIYYVYSKTKSAAADNSKPQRTRRQK